MFISPNCWNRKCKHYLGVTNDGDETTERNTCKAFPDKIPDRVAYGKNKHLTVLYNQDNDIVYEKKKPRMRKVEPYDINENGEKVFNIGADLASANPAIYGRLIMAGKYEEAKKMEDTPMYYADEEDEEWKDVYMKEEDND